MEESLVGILKEYLPWKEVVFSGMFLSAFMAVITHYFPSNNTKEIVRHKWVGIGAGVFIALVLVLEDHTGVYDMNTLIALFIKFSMIFTFAEILMIAGGKALVNKLLGFFIVKKGS